MRTLEETRQLVVSCRRYSESFGGIKEKDDNGNRLSEYDIQNQKNELSKQIIKNDPEFIKNFSELSDIEQNYYPALNTLLGYYRIMLSYEHYSESFRGIKEKDDNGNRLSEYEIQNQKNELCKQIIKDNPEFIKNFSEFLDREQNYFPTYNTLLGYYIDNITKT